MKAPAVQREADPGPAVAWIYCASIIVLAVAINAGLQQVASHSQDFAGILRTRLAAAALMLIRAAYWLALAFVLSRARTLRSFVRTTGLDRPPRFGSWVAAWIAVAIGVLDLMLASTGTPNQRARWFFAGGSGTWWFYVMYSVFISPIFQQTALLGFVYPAFRKSYGPVVSGALVLSVQAFFLWTLIFHSWRALVCLSALWFLILLLRERTRTVWGCIFCLAVYNAVVLRQGLLCVGGMLLLLLCILPRPSVSSAGVEKSGLDGHKPGDDEQCRQSKVQPKQLGGDSRSPARSTTA